MEPIIVAVLVGIAAGLTRSVLGFLNQGEAGESFNKYKLAKSTIRTCIACVTLTMTFIDGELGTEDIGMMYLIAIGADVVWKETYTTGKIKMKG